MDLIFQAAVIGLLQGLTEFIPVSSSAHLELAPWIAGWTDTRVIGSLAFDVFLHLGTLLALLVYFGRDWLRYLGAIVASIRERRIRNDRDRRLAWLLVIATVPAAIIGFVGQDFIDRVLHGDSDAVRLAIAAFLAIGGLALWIADRIGSRNRRLADLSTANALTIGLSQALALLPGISRSGATITAGLALGLNRESAARFSFLLATPITLGAGLVGARKLFEQPLSGNEWAAVAVGFVVAAASGLFAIGFLLTWLRTRSVLAFSLYRLAFAALIVVLVIVR